MAALRSVPAPFLTKTYQLVDDRSTDEVVSWNENGTAFVVWKTAEFGKDLLPNYFKHNNFSSFVRQLNTYGFRKVVPDKWEFANDNFRRGQKELLSEIQRRKAVAPQQAARKSAGGAGSPSRSNSAGEDTGSSSTSSPGSKNLGCVETASMVADLSDENEKLKRENETLSSELAAAKKQRDELVIFLTEHLKVGPDHLERLIRGGTRGPPGTAAVNGIDGDDDHDENNSVKNERVGECLKLFGVWLKGDEKKRARDENFTGNGSHTTGNKNVDFHAPLLKSSKVCN